MWQAARRRPQEAKDASGARWSLFVTLRNGIQQLVETLEPRLLLGEVRRSTPVSTLRRMNGRWAVVCENGSTLQADGVVVATPAFQTERILRETDPQLAERLSTITYSSAATVNLAYRREQVPHPLNGFGFVVPHGEHRAIIAGSFSSVKYAGRAPENHILLRAFVGGSLQAELFNWDDQTMEHAVRRELASLLGIQTSPLFVRVARWPRSMPQYFVGHLKLVEQIEHMVARHAGLALAGNAYRGVGIADCVRSGEAAAEAMLKSLESGRVGEPVESKT
jgi:oxygen-dependent protoporphyrinogen oxidase